MISRFFNTDKNIIFSSLNLFFKTNINLAKILSFNLINKIKQLCLEQIKYLNFFI